MKNKKIYNNNNNNNNSKKKHENVVKNWLCPNFLLLLQKKRGAAAPSPPPASTPHLTKLKRISSSSSNYVVLTFLGEKKIYPLPELVEDKPEYLLPASEVCHAWRARKPPQAVLLWKISKIKQSLVEYGCRATSLTLLTGNIKGLYAATVKKSYIKYKYNWN